MFTIHEIETENKLSVFPRFYAALASSIRSVCGDRGEVRSGRQSVCMPRGRPGALCSAHKAAGVKQNVKSYQCAGDCMIDSRERSHYQQLCERSLHQGDLYMSLCPNLAAGRHVRCGQVVL